MKNSKSSRRYTLALYQIALEKNSADIIKKDFADILRSINASRELSNFLAAPIISSAKKSEIIEAMFAGKVNELTLKFLKLLCDKGRIQNLVHIAEDLLNLMNEKQGIVIAKVKTAVEVTEKEKTSITAKLKQYTGKDITAFYTVDPSIKGGFIAQVEDRIIDASILRQLELLKEKFAQGTFNN
jgi:F-type H+-transporting ATPase subunit delta